MDGTVGLSLQLATIPTTVSGRLSLRAGEVLSIRIGESLGNGRFEVTIRGVSVSVRSGVPLPSGSLLHAKVVIDGKRIELKILEPVVGLLRPPEALSAPPPAAAGNDAATVLIQAMQRTGLPVTAASMSAITAMLPPERRTNPAYVRLATILYDKHLHLAPERLEELYLTINERPHGDSPGGSRQDAWGRSGGRGTRNDSGRPPNTGKAEEGSSLEGVQSASKRPTLTGGLREQLSARGPDALGWPALMNHPVGEHESWVVVPFSLAVGETAVDGSIRLLVTPPPSRTLAGGARMSVSRAVVVVPAVGGFEISGAPPRRVTVYPESDAARGRIAALLPELREKLRNLGVEIDDTNNGDAVFDGFSAETIEIRGVDASA